VFYSEERLRLEDASPGVSSSRQTVYYHLRKWRLDGRLRRAHDQLREACASRTGASGTPARVIDSQGVVKSSRVGGSERGFEGGEAPLREKAPRPGRHQRARPGREGPQSRYLPEREEGGWLLVEGLRQELPRIGLL
jgi:hypothetical protein